MTSAFGAFCDAEIWKFHDRLAAGGVDEEARLDASDQLRGAGFPGLVAVLSVSNERHDLGSELIEKLAERLADHPVAVKAGLEREELARLIARLLDANRDDHGLSERDRRALVAAAVRAVIADAGVHVTTADALQAAELLLSRAFLGDVARSVAAVASERFLG